MDTRGRAEPDWTKRYRLVAGVYAIRDRYILMLERARGIMPARATRVKCGSVMSTPRGSGWSPRPIAPRT
jgi:hypothetical protein